ncbi:MAG: GPR endopeptidase [Erysipelotrichales bacterium]|nr:GPR endopeptidase [Erysipelotrichales bacterium]
MSSYEYRTDFANERKLDGITNDVLDVREAHYDNCTLKIIHIYKEDTNLNSKVGTYYSITFDDLSNHDVRSEVSDVLVECLHEMFDKYDLHGKHCLVVGLGNRFVVADALGSEVCKKILVTSHLDDEREQHDVSEVMSITPGVMGQTGIESSDMIQGICIKTKPDFIIVIDALATKSTNRINKMVQLSDIGIAPGSGVGNTRKAIDQDSLGIPVLVIGVATVVDVWSIVRESIEKGLEFEKIVLKDEQQEELFESIRNQSDETLIVTPREMDADLEHLSEMIAQAVNISLNPKLFNSK